MWKALLSPITLTIKNIASRVSTNKDLELQSATDINKQIIQSETEVKKRKLDIERESVKERGKIINSEANGESWLQRNCRPIFVIEMGSILTILLMFDFVVAPIANACGAHIIILPIPSEVILLTTGSVSGYLGLRSWEKKKGLPPAKGSQ